MSKPESKEKAASSGKLNLGPTGKAALLAAMLSVNAMPAAHAETAPQAYDPENITGLAPKPHQKFEMPEELAAQIDADNAAADEEEKWANLNRSLNNPDAGVERDLPQAPARPVFNVETGENRAMEVAESVKDQAGLDSLLTESRGMLSKSLEGVTSRIPIAGPGVQLLGDSLMVTVATMVDLEVSNLLTQEISRHTSQEAMPLAPDTLIQSNYETDSRNPDNMLLTKTWGGHSEDGTGWKLTAGINPLQGVGLKFDPTAGVVFEKKF